MQLRPAPRDCASRTLYGEVSNILPAILGAVLNLLLLQDQAYARGKDAIVDQNAVRAFMVAAKANDVDALLRGLDRGVPVDSRDSRGRTALLVATYHDAVEAADFLIREGADVNAKDELQDSPFLFAGAEGKLEILKLTVAAGADLESVNRYGGTALIPAAHHGHVDVVRYLLTTEINIDYVNNLGWTALLEAVVLGNGGPTYQQIVKLLLDAGADASIADKEGKTPFQQAKAHGQSEIARILQIAKFD